MGGCRFFAGPAADERDALLTFLGVPRAALRAAVFGLTDEQALDGRHAGLLLDAYEAG